MTPDELQAALDAATATLAAGGIPRASLHARDVLALVACVSALRDVLAQTERERDEARRVVRFVEARNATREAFADVRSRGCDRATFDALEDRAAIFADYGGMLAERRRDTAWGPTDTAEACGLAPDALAAVEHCKRPPFPDDVTRRLCAFLGCDPGPLLDAAAKCEEAMR